METEIKEARKTYLKLLMKFGREELEKKEKPMRWEYIGVVGGYDVNRASVIMKSNGCVSDNTNKNIFRTWKQAKSSLAKAQLSQLMWIWNEGWDPNWEDEYQVKHCINRRRSEIIALDAVEHYEFLALKNSELRYEFMTTFQELIKEYFEI